MHALPKSNTFVHNFAPAWMNLIGTYIDIPDILLQVELVTQFLSLQQLEELDPYCANGQMLLVQLL